MGRKRYGVFIGLLSAVVVVVLVQAAVASATAMPTSITKNTTLLASKSPYVGSSSTVKSGVTLTIEPGVTVKLEGGLIVNGTLTTAGTKAAPVVLTSNGTGEPGQWVGVTFAKTAGASSLSYTTVRYAVVGLRINSSSPSITNSTITSNSEAAAVVEGGAPTLEYDTFSHSGRGVGYSFPEGKSGSIHFDHDQVEGNEGDGLDVVANTAAEKIETASVGNNSFVGNGGKAIYYDAYATATGLYHSNPIPPDITTNSLSSNAENGVWLRGAVEQATLWESHGYAIVQHGEGILIPGGKTLTIGPGSVVKTELGSAISVEGALNTEGSASEPVIFTSLYDDSADGDTNGDGSATSPARGDWYGILLEPGATGTISRSIVRYGGIGLRIRAASPTFSHGTITRNSEAAATVEAGSPVFEYDTISDNRGGVSYSVPKGASSSIHFDNNQVEGNEGDGLDVVANTAAEEIKTASAGNNSFVENAGKAIYYDAYATTTGEYHSNPIPPNIATNTLSGNAENGIWLSGEVAQSTTWEAHGYALVELQNGGATVAEGATLTLEPGTVVKGEAGSGMLIVGTLVTQGEKGNPITFTSVADDSVDGDTNGDGSATAPAIRDWDGIFFEDSIGEPSIKYDGFRYAKVALGFRDPHNPNVHIEHSEFVENTASIEDVERPEREPCTPVYAFTVFIDESWFSPGGYPTATTNTLPYAFYSCPEEEVPPVLVTNVVIGPVLEEPLEH